MKTTIEWHYLPELPKKFTPLLISSTYKDCILSGHYSGNGWYEDIDDYSEIGDISVYAWAYLPELPPFKN